MKSLFIVSTYYHALIACVKQLVFRQNADILVTEYIQQHHSLGQRIEACRLFDRVLYTDGISEYCPKNRLDFVLNNHRKNAALIEKQLPFSMREYDSIFIFHDDTWFAHYLKCAKIRYHIIEDGYDIFKRISKTQFGYMLHKRDIKSAIKNHFRIGYVFWGYDKYTLSVEVNDAEGLEISELARGKIKELPRKELFAKLTAADIEALRDIFMKEVPPFDSEKSVLLLTQPLREYRAETTDEEQVRFYILIAEKYSSDYQLVIKPHPRDVIEYASVFPDAVVLDRNMPVEILDIVSGIHFARAVAFNSTCVVSIPADEHINLSSISDIP